MSSCPYLFVEPLSRLYRDCRFPCSFFRSRFFVNIPPELYPRLLASLFVLSPSLWAISALSSDGVGGWGLLM